MAYLLFLDESGHDRKLSPYEVLAGVAVEDRRLWPLITQLNDAQEHHFGLRLHRIYGKELKAQKLLKTKVYVQAAKRDPIPVGERTLLARAALENGSTIGGEQLIALCQAKIAYCLHALRICRGHGCRAFASIIPNDIERPPVDVLRKDYAFLFERYYQLLDNAAGRPMGIIVFDESDKNQSQILLNQMEEYFLRTNNGRTRSRLVVPEPLFVHSDLTTLVQVADIIAYVISWGWRTRQMTAPYREDLKNVVNEVIAMQHHGLSQDGYEQHGFKLIRSLAASANGKGSAALPGRKASAIDMGAPVSLVNE